MARAFLAESIYGTFATIDDAALATVVTQVVDKGFSFVLEADGEAHGMIGGAMIWDALSGEPALEEAAWWVDPEYRGYGGLLLDTFEAAALTVEIPNVKMVTPVSNPFLAKLLRRRGYAPLETIHLKRLR